MRDHARVHLEDGQTILIHEDHEVYDVLERRIKPIGVCPPERLIRVELANGTRTGFRDERDWKRSLRWR